jgi:hypothetical protein
LILDPNKSEYRSTHLKTTSVLRVHRLATIHCSSLVRSLGTLEAYSFAVVASKVKQLLGL